MNVARSARKVVKWDFSEWFSKLVGSPCASHIHCGAEYSWELDFSVSQMVSAFLWDKYYRRAGKKDSNSNTNLKRNDEKRLRNTAVYSPLFCAKTEKNLKKAGRRLSSCATQITDLRGFPKRLSLLQRRMEATIPFMLTVLYLTPHYISWESFHISMQLSLPLKHHYNNKSFL